MDTIDTTMTDRLAAAGPHAEHRDALATYGQLVGTWDVDNRWRRADGGWDEGTVVWTFGWIIDGHAIQDVMRFRLPDGSTATGTTVRLYDPTDNLWHIVWFPSRGKTCTLIGRPDDEGITQEGTEGDGRRIRWTFREMTGDSFHWTGSVSTDGGQTWELEQEMFARRSA